MQNVEKLGKRSSTILALRYTEMNVDAERRHLILQYADKYQVVWDEVQNETWSWKNQLVSHYPLLSLLNNLDRENFNIQLIAVLLGI